MCLSSKDSREKVYFVEEAEVDDYDSKESLLMIEEISAIEGRGKQMASSIIRWPTTATAKLTFALVFHNGYHSNKERGSGNGKRGLFKMKNL